MLIASGRDIGGYRFLSGIPRVLLYLFISETFLFIGSITSFYLVVFLYQNNYSIESISILQFCFSSGGFAGCFLGGYCVEKMNIRPCIILFNGLSCMTLLTLFIINKAQQQGLCLFIFNIGLYASKPCFNALYIQLCVAKERALIMSVRNVLMNVAAGFSASIGGYLLVYHARTIFLFDAIFIGLGLSFFIMLFRATKGCTVDSKEEKIKPLKIEIKTVISLLIGIFIAFLIFSQVKTTFPLYLKKIGFDNSDLAKVYLLNAMLVVFLEIPLIKLAIKYTTRIFIVVGYTLLGVGVYLTQYIDSYVWLICSVVVWSLGEIIFFPNAILLLSKSKKFLGFKLAGYQFSANLAFVVGPYIGFYLLSNGRSMLLWNLCILLGTLGSCGLYLSIVSASRAKTMPKSKD